MDRFFFLFLGGGSGALLRYALSGATHRVMGAKFPWGTLSVNFLGCLLMGILWGISERYIVPQRARLFLFTGLLGAFTTFSTFGLETFSLLRDGQHATAAGNILASNIGGIALLVLGFAATKGLFRFFS